MDLDPRFRFETYVVGAGNRLAVSAARAVAQAPGATYNPLFLYSGSGLGKTHLLFAVAHLARERQAGLAMEYITAEEFVEELNRAVAGGAMEAFRERWSAPGLLLVDDVQFLSGRRETQTELLRLFNLLQRSGRQVVLASDRPPTEIADVDERLVSRLSGGLVVDVGEPDYETRVAILRMRCEERGTRFEPGVLEQVARLGHHNVRELQGALNRLIAFQTLGEAPVTAGNVRTLLGMSPDARAGTTPARGSEFDQLLSDVSIAVTRNVDPWRLRVSEAITYWHELGYQASALERALEGERTPDVDALLAEYEGGIARLRDLQQAVGKLDSRLAASGLFLDPERLGEAEAVAARLLGNVEPPPRPLPEFSLAALEVGASNQLAVHAADVVVRQSGARYNPLFVFGPPAVGKTHWLHGLGNALLAAHPTAAVACLGARQFGEELIAALQAGAVERWRARFRVVDALLMDDVEALAGSERTQEEFFHLFNSLHASGRQIVLTAGAAPGALAGVADRLRSRFEGGLVVEMQAPDPALRERLFARRLSATSGRPDRSLVDYLASRPVASVAEVDAIVSRLNAAAGLVGAPLTVAFARKELEGGVSTPSPARPGRAVDPFFLDPERIIWEWPELTGRLVEEYR